MNLRRALSTTAVAAGAVLLSIGIQTFAAGTWTPPSSTAPAGDADAPINTGSLLQTKTGAFTVSGAFTASGGLTAGALVSNTSNKVIIGGGGASGSSGVPLTVNGQIRLTGAGGTAPVAGSVLTASGSGGDATWTRMKAGYLTNSATSGKLSITVTNLNFPDTAYSVAVSADGGTTDCRAVYITNKTTTGFTINAGDTCTNVTYDWIALDR